MSDRDSQWLVFYSRLCDYYRYNGNSDAPEHIGELGEWVRSQRVQHQLYQNDKPCEITSDQIAMLESIEFNWNIITHDINDHWHYYYEQLKQFQNNYGHLNVTESHNPELLAWISVQRTQYRDYIERKETTLGESQITALESIGFDWKYHKDPAKKAGVEWEEKFEELCQFKQEKGICDVPLSHATLGKWCQKQRYAYKLYKKGDSCDITPEQIKRLEDIGFRFNPRKNSEGWHWDYYFDELKQYKAKHATLDIVASHNMGLYSWIARQKTLYKNFYKKNKKCILSQERVKALEDLGFQWKSKDSRRKNSWPNLFGELTHYFNRTGHTDVPRNHKLCKWIARQRSLYRMHLEGKSTELTEDRIKKLESLNIDWNISGKKKSNNTWNYRYEELKNFQRIKKHCNVTKYDAQKYFTLSIWVSLQRRNYKQYKAGKQSPMTPERIAALEELGFDWDWDWTKPQIPKQDESPPDVKSSTGIAVQRIRDESAFLIKTKNGCINVKLPPANESQTQSKELKGKELKSGDGVSNEKNSNVASAPNKETPNSTAVNKNSNEKPAFLGKAKDVCMDMELEEGKKLQSEDVSNEKNSNVASAPNKETPNSTAVNKNPNEKPAFLGKTEDICMDRVAGV